jgi:hypothetical protein
LRDGPRGAPSEKDDFRSGRGTRQQTEKCKDQTERKYGGDAECFRRSHISIISSPPIPPGFAVAVFLDAFAANDF